MSAVHHAGIRFHRETPFIGILPYFECQKRKRLKCPGPMLSYITVLDYWLVYTFGGFLGLRQTALTLRG